MTEKDQKPSQPNPQVTANVPGGVESPVFWGSVLGIVTSALFAGHTYLAGGQPQNPQPPEAGWIVATFACIVGIRYYTSVVFLSYDDFLSNRIKSLGPTGRKGIFISQCILILGSSLNISLLTTFGAIASGVIIIVQALSTALYWKPLWQQLIRGPEGNFRLFMALGEIAVGALAGHVVLRHMGVIKDIQGESLLLGAVIMVFITECVTTYWKSVREFAKRTAIYLEG